METLFCHSYLADTKKNTKKDEILQAVKQKKRGADR